MTSQNQSQSENQKVPQQTSQPVNDQPRATLDRSENYPIFQ